MYLIVNWENSKVIKPIKIHRVIELHGLSLQSEILKVKILMPASAFPVAYGWPNNLLFDLSTHTLPTCYGQLDTSSTSFYFSCARSFVSRQLDAEHAICQEVMIYDALRLFISLFKINHANLPWAWSKILGFMWCAQLEGTELSLPTSVRTTTERRQPAHLVQSVWGL